MGCQHLCFLSTVFEHVFLTSCHQYMIIIIFLVNLKSKKKIQFCFRLCSVLDIVLFCFSLIINEVKHFLRCLLIIYVSPFTKVPAPALATTYGRFVAHQLPLSMDCPGMKTGVGCHFLLQEIFPTQWSNPWLLHCQVDSLSTEPLLHT